MGREREKRYSEREGVERLIERKKRKGQANRVIVPIWRLSKNRSQTGRKEKI